LGKIITGKTGLKGFEPLTCGSSDQNYTQRHRVREPSCDLVPGAVLTCIAGQFHALLKKAGFFTIVSARAGMDLLKVFIHRMEVLLL